MLRELPLAEFISIGINLNYYSTATVLLGSLEAPLQKRTGSTFGPPGSTHLVYFIGTSISYLEGSKTYLNYHPRADDLNLPQETARKKVCLSDVTRILNAPNNLVLDKTNKKQAAR